MNMSNWVKGEDPMQLTNKSTDRNAYNELQLRFVELVEKYKLLEQENEKLKEQNLSAGATAVRIKPILLIWEEYITTLPQEELQDLKNQYHIIKSTSQDLKTI